jgi:hypothetical protein
MTCDSFFMVDPQHRITSTDDLRQLDANLNGDTPITSSRRRSENDNNTDDDDGAGDANHFGSRRAFELAVRLLDEQQERNVAVMMKQNGCVMVLMMMMRVSTHPPPQPSHQQPIKSAFSPECRRVTCGVHRAHRLVPSRALAACVCGHAHH